MTMKPSTLTVAELIAILEDQDPDMPVMIACDYGDRGRTMQALPIHRVEEDGLRKSAYSDSGWALAIADELFQVRRTQSDMTKRLDQLSTELSRLLPPVKRGSRATDAFASTRDGA